MGRSRQNFIECASGSRCLGGRSGTPARLNPSDPRQKMSISTGYCAACRHNFLTPYFRPTDGNIPYGETPALKSKVSLLAGGEKDWTGHSPIGVALSLTDLFPPPGVDALTRENNGIEKPKAAPEKVPHFPLNIGAREGEPAGGRGGEAPRQITAAHEPSSFPPGQGRPQDGYFKQVTDYLSARGLTASSWEDAVAMVAHLARESSNLSSIDIVDVMDKFDAIEKTHLGAESAAIAAAFALGQPVVVTNQSGAGVEAVMRVAADEGMEFQIVKAPHTGANGHEIKAAIKKLSLQLSRFPAPSTGGIVVAVTGLAKASPEFKSELIGAIINRRVGTLPVPPKVHIALIETGHFSVSDYPTEVLLAAVSLSVKGRHATPAEVALAAGENTKRLFERQLAAARLAGDTRKIERIEELLARPGYVGSHPSLADLRKAGAVDPREAGGAVGTQAKTGGGTAGSPAGQGKKTPKSVPGDEDLAASLAALGSSQTSAVTRDEKAAFIMAVVAPEKSRLRKEVAEKLLVGIGGKTFADNALSNYRRRAMEGYVTPSVEGIIAGAPSTGTIRAALAGGDKIYASTLASELRESPLVPELMKNTSEAASRLMDAFLALLEHEPEMASELAKDRPLFVNLGYYK